MTDSVPPDAFAVQSRSHALVGYGAMNLSDGRHTPEHQHGKGQLIGTESGLVTLTINGCRHLVSPTQVVWLPPHTPHALSSHGAFRGWSVYVAEVYCDRLPPQPQTLMRSELLHACVERLATWAQPVLEPTPAQQRVWAVMADELNTLAPAALSLPYPQTPAVQKAAAVMLADLSAEHALPALAALVGLSARSLSRKFVQETGQTFTQWRQQARLMRALAYLAAGASVTTTALSVGYDNVSAFIALFQRRLGQTPSRYFSDQADRLK